ncbi:hypothetical protein JK358_21960 [Nocardia sp. 2]|uniref:Secreted protein n=1 Tax=Nocardia acididurans TaxID=2802282 RepID=A0ABS1M8U7_9NOCA|nr:hypothetical protein [Nocardia acididurans]MBL1077068.1 hypothetical protein [Nocardia acididurans]
MAVFVAVGLGVSAVVSVPAMVFGGLPNPNYPQPGYGLPPGCVLFCPAIPGIPAVPALPDCAVPPYDDGTGWTMPLSQGASDSPFGVLGE